jgi:hypothetical protein
MSLLRVPIVLALLGAGVAAAAAPEKDTLLFNNGEKLIGRFLRSGGATLTFRSDSAGELTVPWTAVKELHTASKFAVVQKDVKLGRGDDMDSVPRGKLSVEANTILVQRDGDAPPTRIAVKDSGHVIEERTFERAARDPGFLHGWSGSVTAGASLVEATQHGRTFNGAITLSRPIPAETWLPARNRTSFSLNGAYGTLNQPVDVRLKTEIYRVAIEHDQYVSARFYGFVQSAWDHNFSQGLDLQQSYGGGIGWTISKTPKGAVDVKTSLTYLNQQFREPQPSQDLVGSTFAQTLQRRLWNGIQLNQQMSVTPTWNNRNSYAAQGNMALTVPVYKRVSFTVGTVDTFLNNPAPGYKKNSFQLNTGLTYTLPTR